MKEPDPKRIAGWLAWLIIGWVVIAALVFASFALVRLGQEILAVPDGPPPYGYDCDSAYRLAEANCPQDR